MAIGLRVEDRLSGVDHFCPLKKRMTLLFEELEVWDIVESLVQPPTNQT